MPGIQDTLWTGIRTFLLKNSKIHDCEFVDAGGRWQHGEPGVKGGFTGGAIFSIWMADTEIAHSRFVPTKMDKADEFYGIKVRQGKRCRIHHNTIQVNFSLEFPFENDEDVEIEHNVKRSAKFSVDGQDIDHVVRQSRGAAGSERVSAEASDDVGLRPTNT